MRHRAIILSKKNKIALGSVIIFVAIASYIYLSGNRQSDKSDTADSIQEINPEDILKYDPNAPEWMQEAESCTLVAGKVFCKLREE